MPDGGQGDPPQPPTEEMATGWNDKSPGPQGTTNRLFAFRWISVIFPSSVFTFTKST